MAAMDWVALSLACALAVASTDAFTKKLLSDYRAGEIAAVRLAWAGALLLPWALAQPWPAPRAAFWGWAAALLPLEIAALIMYMRAISVAPLHDTLPYLAFTPVFTALTGYLLLGERIGAQGLAGIALVTAGGYLLNVDTADGRWREPLAPLRRMRRERGPRLMLAVAVLYSLTSVLGKGALQYVPATFLGAWYFIVLALALIGPAAIARPASLAVLVRRPGAHLLIGACFAIMAVTHFLAIERIEAAYMIALKRTSLLFGILYGVVLFGEPHPLRHLAIGTLMVAGVALIVA